jgi:riboflavin synthase
MPVGRTAPAATLVSLLSNEEQVVRMAGMGRRPATPSAMVLVDSVVTTRRWRHE